MSLWEHHIIIQFVIIDIFLIITYLKTLNSCPLFIFYKHLVPKGTNKLYLTRIEISNENYSLVIFYFQ
jgi:hypothetical protein